MKNLFRLALGAGMLGAVLVGGTYACPRLTSRLGLNLAEFADLQKQIEDNCRRAEELDRLSRVVFHNVLLKEQVIDELRDGRLDLLGAAARFRDISRTLPVGHLQFFRDAFPSPTLEETYCRQVLHYLRTEALRHPEVRATEEEMEADLNARLHEGPLRLPEE